MVAKRKKKGLRGFDRDLYQKAKRAVEAAESSGDCFDVSAAAHEATYLSGIGAEKAQGRDLGMWLNLKLRASDATRKCIRIRPRKHQVDWSALAMKKGRRR